MVKTLDRDLEVAGIPKADERGRTIDFHSLRHTFGTLLSVGGVNPGTAHQAMRHSDIKLTMNTYTDPKLLDLAGAIESLPNLKIPTLPELTNRQQQKATGTENSKSFVAPTVAPVPVKSMQKESFPDIVGTLPVQSENEKKPQKPCFRGVLKG